jgi:hypothetical protein
MSFLKAMQNFEFTVSGGFAWYFLICVCFVTISGIIQIIRLVINWINH